MEEIENLKELIDAEHYFDLIRMENDYFQQLEMEKIIEKEKIYDTDI